MTTRKLSVSLLYLVSVVLVNMGFAYLPIFDTPYGPLPMMAFFVGFIFVIRDFAQREVGHRVVWLMLVAAALVWLVVDPMLAVASTVAFLLSEFIDWLVYTITRRPFHDRILISSAFSVPVDTVAFLGLMGFLSTGSFVIMSGSKFLASVLIWFIWRRYRLS